MPGMTKLLADWPIPPNVASMKASLSIASISAMRKSLLAVGPVLGCQEP